MISLAIINGPNFWLVKWFDKLDFRFFWKQHGSPLFFLDFTNVLEHNFATSYASKLFQWPHSSNHNLLTLVENLPFLTKSFQLHDICNYVSIGFFNFKIKLWKLSIKLFLFTILVYSWKHFSTTWSFAEYSQHWQCLQVELLTMLVNNLKHVSIKGSFLKYSWHFMFFCWHIVKKLTSVQLFWMIKCMDDKM
jgi:hypothetical protein